jgi:ketosteroid isomerase-like protein
MFRISASGYRGLWVALFVAVWLSGPSTLRARAQDADLETEARQALTDVFDALASGDAEKVRPFIAPEYQIVRSDGAVYNKEDYLARSIPRIESKPTFSNVIATRNGDIVVVSLRLQIEEHVDGKKAESVFPHLIVFRVTPDGWQVVASANFAKLQE